MSIKTGEVHEIFDLISHDKATDGKLKPYLSKNNYYDEEKNFINVITNNSTYSDKLRFYAFYAGLSNGLNGESLISWMRIIFNLTENTVINISKQYQGALKSINEMLKRNVPILEQLRQDVPISLFMEAQVTEEKIKAHLMDKSPKWKVKILELENHPFFRGQIGFILKFSGIFDFYIKNKNLKWCESEQLYYYRNFIRYAESASAVFYYIEKDSKDINYAWERAVLTKGEYFTAASANRFNLLSIRLYKNNIDRDHSWKRLLRVSPNQVDSSDLRQSYVKAVLDDLDFDLKDIPGSLEKICTKASKELLDQDWRYILITKPDLFKLCQQGFIVKNDSEIILLHESQRNHYHSEIYSKFLHLEFIDKHTDISPFEIIEYNEAKSEENFTYITFEGFSYLTEQYSMDIWYESNKYLLVFYSKNKELSKIPFENILGNCNFSRIQDLDKYDEEEWGEYPYGYVFQCETVQQAMDNFKKLCKKLCNQINK